MVDMEDILNSWDLSAQLVGTSQEMTESQFSVPILIMIHRTAEKIRIFMGWLNDAAVTYGGRQVHVPTILHTGRTKLIHPSMQIDGSPKT